MSEEMNYCRSCKHFRRETESWEMPHIFWYECKAVPGRANLKSFPFKRTNCSHFVHRGEDFPKNLTEMLQEAQI